MKSSGEKKPNFVDSGQIFSLFTLLYYSAVGIIVYVLQSNGSNSLHIGALATAILWPLVAVLGGIVGIIGPFIGSPSHVGLLVATFTLGPYLIFIVLLTFWQKQRATNRALFNQNLRDKQKRETEQRELTHQIQNLTEESFLLSTKLEAVLDSATENLKVAQQDFVDGVINPFWEAIEETTKQLSFFEMTVTSIRDNNRKFRELCEKLGRVPCPIKGEISESTFHRATVLARQLRLTVREAQKNPTFATVYEQRRTTSAVFHGFSSLSTAIHGMESRIVGCMEGLASTFHSSLDNLQTAQQEASLRLGDHVKQLTGSLDSIDEGIKSSQETQGKTHKLLEDYIKERNS